MMSLIERLRIGENAGSRICEEAADRIEELEKANERLTTENQRIEDEMVSFGRGFEKEIKRLKVSLAGSEGAVSQQHKDIKALRDENGRKQERVDELEVRCQELGDSRDRWQATAQTQDDLLNQQSAEVSRYETALRWALGESPPDTPEFPLVDGPPYYRWRTTLRLLAGLRPDGTKFTPDSGSQCARCKRPYSGIGTPLCPDCLTADSSQESDLKVLK